MTQIQYPNDITGSIQITHGSDGRLNVSSRSDARAYYNSRDRGQTYSFSFEDTGVAVGDEILFLKNDSVDKTLVISHIGIGSTVSTSFNLQFEIATDLTGMAEDGKLDPVIGRELEIERVIQILARRNKNNPALIGEPGVGKTAIVEGLAQRISDGDVPAPLLGKRVLQLDVGSLVAGTMYRGQFEERLKKVIDELKASDAILFIDDVTPAESALRGVGYSDLRRRLLIAELAIQAYRDEKGSPPESLDALVSDFLPAVPENPCRATDAQRVQGEPVEEPGEAVDS